MAWPAAVNVVGLADLVIVSAGVPAVVTCSGTTAVSLAETPSVVVAVAVFSTLPAVTSVAVVVYVPVQSIDAPAASVVAGQVSAVPSSGSETVTPVKEAL